MSSTTDHSLLLSRRRRPSPLERLARRAVSARLGDLSSGSIRIVDGDSAGLFGSTGGRFDVTIHVHDPAFWRAIATRGAVGAGESYVRGEWSTDDLVGLMRMLVNERDVLRGLDRGLARLARPLLASFAALHRNSRAGARANIEAHYDLGNDFFELFLDETMMYSAALFERPEDSLHQAQLTKLDHICRKLDLRPGDRVLEIGTGWGGFAIHAAERFGVHVTTTTISRAQHDRAGERFRERGLDRSIDLLYQDYRDLRGRYDKLVSIEMIEAIGHDQYPTFFEQCARLLNPDGRMLIQSITIADQAYERARRSVDFIKRHIFPGSCIPSVTALMAAATAASDLRLVHLDSLTSHYATTLAAWRHDLLRNRGEALRRGYDEELIRKWEYYLALCEGGFAERYLGDVHMTFDRPDRRRPLPVTASAGPRRVDR